MDVRPFRKVTPKLEKTRDKYIEFDEMRLIFGNVPAKGRVRFERFKGGAGEAVDNIVCQEAQEILDYYRESSQPYIVPIHKSKSYQAFFTNYIVG